MAEVRVADIVADPWREEVALELLELLCQG